VSSSSIKLSARQRRWLASYRDQKRLHGLTSTPDPTLNLRSQTARQDFTAV
jgi:hypothetical protein